ncbi:hypothetical protein H4I96_06773 [Botrytis cinerea]
MCNKTIYLSPKVTRYLREDSFVASRTFKRGIQLDIHKNTLACNNEISRPQGASRVMPTFSSQCHTCYNPSHREMSIANWKTASDDGEFMIFIKIALGRKTCRYHSGQFGDTSISERSVRCKPLHCGYAQTTPSLSSYFTIVAVHTRTLHLLHFASERLVFRSGRQNSIILKCMEISRTISICCLVKGTSLAS